MDIQGKTMALAAPGAGMPLRSGGPGGDPADLRRAAEGFESLFLATLLKGGRAGSFGDELTGSKAVDDTRDMLDAELARVTAGHSRLGIAEAVERQFAGHVAGRAPAARDDGTGGR